MWMTLDRSPYLVRITVPPRVADVSAQADRGHGHADPERARHRGPRRGPAGRRDVAERGERERRRRHGRVPGDAGAERARERPHATSSACAPPTRPAAPSRRASSSRSRATPTRRPTPTPPPAPTPPPTPPEVTVAPVPVQGKTVVLTAGTGTVRIKAPGQDGYITLDSASNVPVGSLIDTTAGSVVLASRVGGKTQSGTFHGGKFRVQQERSGMTALTLAGELDLRPAPRPCRRAREAEAEEAPRLGPGQRRALPDARQEQRRDRARDALADRGHLHRDARAGHAGRGLGQAGGQARGAGPRGPLALHAAPPMRRTVLLAGARRRRSRRSRRAPARRSSWPSRRRWTCASPSAARSPSRGWRSSRSTSGRSPS